MIAKALTVRVIQEGGMVYNKATVKSILTQSDGTAVQGVEMLNGDIYHCKQV